MLTPTLHPRHSPDPSLTASFHPAPSLLPPASHRTAPAGHRNLSLSPTPPQRGRAARKQRSPQGPQQDTPALPPSLPEGPVTGRDGTARTPTPAPARTLQGRAAPALAMAPAPAAAVELRGGA